jgi:hypothetical protein
MASKVNICNLALSHLGDEGTVSSIDPPEGSAQAEHCAMWYPVARDVMLESHDWWFATRRKTLVLFDPDVVEAHNWSFAYALPNNCLAVRSVTRPGASTLADSEDFELESRDDGSGVVYTNAEEASIRYIVRADDPAKYPGLVTEALSWLLASYLAGPVLKGDAGATAAVKCEQVWLNRLNKAAAADAMQRQVPTRVEAQSSFLTVR